MDLYIHSHMLLHGVVFNQLSTGTTLPFFFTFRSVMSTWWTHDTSNDHYNYRSRRRDSSDGLARRLCAGLLRNRGSIPGAGK
jgi:hypothetical protein